MITLLLVACSPVLEPLELPAGDLEACVIAPDTEIGFGTEHQGSDATGTVVEVDGVWPGGEYEEWACTSTPSRNVHLESGGLDYWIGWTWLDASGEDLTPDPGFVVGDTYLGELSVNHGRRRVKLEASEASSGADTGGDDSKGDLFIGDHAVTGVLSDAFSLVEVEEGDPGAFEGCPAVQTRFSFLDGTPIVPGEVADAGGWDILVLWTARAWTDAWSLGDTPDCAYRLGGDTFHDVSLGDFMWWKAAETQ